ncbi:site-specific DNA-methyltransferase [uncultured Helicobacter sp.]|uniref:site-specific DNA-methyltransferase n=1 Tax=uncultured Helicobacter sp. TaxID=175537 RepID=UPI002610DD88|nr:site-specific DNA-methyltransferase [uncultured Helicobacter sp.]
MIDKKQAAQKGIKILERDSNPLEEMLKTHFPQSIREGQVNLNAIAALLGKDISNMQGYELTFTGKGLANALYTTPCQKVLKHKETFCHSKTSSCHSESLANSSCHSEGARATEESQNIESHKDNRDVSAFSKPQHDKERNCRSNGFPSCHSESLANSSCHSEPALAGEESQNEVSSPLPHLSLKEESQTNTLIIGDNLDALKILKSAYSEKIKMIYIDPPYNTKNDNFIYPDDFRADYKAILREVGLLEIDENGQEIPSETLQFFRNITGSKSHSGWLSFILPRLKLARDLLKDEGVIFISIDDNEQANLKLLCDEIFGEENFVCCFVWRRKTGASDAKGIANIIEYILCYVKNSDFLDFSFNKNLESHDEKRYKLSDKYIERRGKYYIDNLDRGGIHYSDSLNYAIECPDGTITYPNGRKNYVNEGWVWTWGKDKFKWGLENGFIEFRKSKHKESGWAVCYKNYLFVDNEDKIIQRAAPHKNLILDILNTHATLELNDLFNAKLFTAPKPINLIKHFLQISTSSDSNDIILDFFAGSGTTAQAVMELNAEDKGNRQFILVQLDEPIKEEKSKTAYDFCKNELGSENPTISDITIDRVKRAAKKINANMCLNIFTLESKPKLISDEKGTLALTTNTNLSALDKAINLALSAGKTLSQTLQVVIEDKLYKCEDSYFCIECDKGVLETLAQTSDEYIYLDGFADINLESFLNLDAQFKERLNVVY